MTEDNTLKSDRHRRHLRGVVIRKNTPQTVVVQVTTRGKHLVYKKYMTNRKRYLVHDPQTKAKLGDLVDFKESRPISAGKKFVLSQILGSQTVEVAGVEV